jgi:hypothetical protein
MTFRHLVLSLAVAAIPISASAVSITLPGLPGYDRQATLGDATAGYFGDGNAIDTTVEGYLGGNWTERGSIAGSNGTSGSLSDGIFKVTLLVGSWGNQPVISGTWEILDALFWSKYARGAISMHVGGGKPDDPNTPFHENSPEHFVWLLEKNKLTGTWSYDSNTGKGGGLSNLKLFSEGTGTRVPDTSSTLALMGLSLAALGFVARRKSA